MRRFELLPILLLAISSNGDNVAVGIAYGLGRINVPLTSNLLIALVTGAFTLLSMLLGQAIGNLMAPRLSSSIGGAIIAVLGGWVIVQSVRTNRQREGRRADEAVSPNRFPGVARRILRVLDNPAGADSNFSREIELRESWVLAVALSLNNTVNGIAAGMVGMNPLLLTAAVMLFSMLMLSSGLMVGSQIGKRWVGGLSGVVSGLMLMLLGLYEIHA